MLETAVKTALLPVAIVKDAVNVATDKEINSTESLLESAAKDVSEAIDDLADGDVL